MAFESNNFYVAKKEALAKSEYNVEFNISAGSNVEKILSISLEGCVESYEALNGVINYSGYIDSKIIFLSDDGQINTVCSSCPLSSKFEGEDIANGQTALINLNIIDYNIDSITGDLIKLTAIVEQSGFIISSNETGSIRSDDEDICSKNEEMSVVKFLGCTNGKSEVKSEINSRGQIIKILLTESNAYVKSVESGVNFVTISGEVVSRVLYLSEDEKFESGYVYETFKEELELEGVTKDSLVEGHAHVRPDMVTSEIVQDERGCKIVVTSIVELKVCAYNEEKIEVIQDLYSTKCDINVTTQSFSMTNVCKMDTIEGKIEGNMVLEDDKPRVDKILFSAGNNVNITNKYIKDDEIFVEGIAKTYIVYLNDETNSINSVELEIPFSLSDKFEGGEDGKIFASAVIYDSDVAVKKGRELFYDAKIKICINYCSDTVCGIISAANCLEEYPEKDYAMEVMFARAGEELWDIAKKAKIKEQQILDQNPDVVFPLNEDTTLILFYQKVR